MKCNPWKIALLIACITTAAFVAVVLTMHRSRYSNIDMSATDNLRQLYGTPDVVQTPSKNTPTPTQSSSLPSVTPLPTPTPIPTIAPAFQRVMNANPHTAGWLSIPGLGIDYPVFYTPFDQNYYLYKTADGKYSSAGSLFMSLGSEIMPQAQTLLIYGHNARTSMTMFARITDLHDMELVRQNAFFSFDTLYQQGMWKIIAVTPASINLDINDWDYLKNQYYNDEEFDNFIYQMRIRSLFRIADDPTIDDNYLILSTCDKCDFGRPQRLLVVARKVRDGESTDNYYIEENPLVLYPVEWYQKYKKQQPSQEAMRQNYAMFYEKE